MATKTKAKVKKAKSKTKTSKHKHLKLKSVSYRAIEVPYKDRQFDSVSHTSDMVIDGPDLVAVFNCTVVMVSAKALKAAIKVVKAKRISLLADGKEIDKAVMIIDEDNEEFDISQWTKIGVYGSAQSSSDFSFTNIHNGGWDERVITVGNLTNDMLSFSVGEQGGGEEDTIYVKEDVLKELLSLI